MPPFIKIPPKFKEDDKSNVATLHKALEKLDLQVADGEKKTKAIDRTTVSAIKKFQKARKLGDDGKLTPATINAMNELLHDNFVAENKYRTEKLHSLLGTLDLKVDPKEVSERKTGPATRKAIEVFQGQNRMTVNGLLSEDVFNRLQEIGRASCRERV